MKKLSFQTQVILGFSFSLVLLLSVSVLSYRSIQKLEKDNQMIDHTQVVLQKSSHLLNSAIELETGQRGYVITGKEKFLEPFIKGKNEVKAVCSDLRELISDNPEQVKRVETLEILLNEKIQDSELKIKLRRENGFEAARDVVATGVGKELSDTIRKTVLEMQQAEQLLLTKRKVASDQSSSLTVSMLVASGILSVLVVLFLLSYIVKTFRKQKEAEERTLQANIELEKLFIENADKNWLLTGSTLLNENIRGDKPVAELAQIIVNSVAAYTGLLAGAFFLYNEQKERFEFSAGNGNDKDVILRHFRTGETLSGQAAQRNATVCIDDLPENYFNLSSSFGKATPSSLIICPLYNNGKAMGVIELVSSVKNDTKSQNYLDFVKETISISLEAAKAREKTQRLHEQTLQQAEELESQQEELRQTNAELTQQSQLLQASEEELRVQQEELRQINAELEEKAAQMEEQNELVEQARLALVLKAEELEMSSRYKSEFLANMSHELRTPLNSILILARLLGENKLQHLSTEEIKYANVIYNAGNDLLNLINDILDLSKIEAGKIDLTIEQIPLEEVKSDLLGLFKDLADSRKTSFLIDIDEASPAMIVSDKQRIEQVLKNLLSNAFKFTAQNGSVTVNISMAASGKLAFAVKDTGIGIPKEKQAIIFEAFKQADGSTNRKYGGTGLGLSISKELAFLLGGHISVESVAGEGSTFTLYINPNAGIPEETEKEPVMMYAAPTPAREIFDAIPHNDAGSSKEILIIEDDKNFADILCVFAEDKGFSTQVAYDGIVGLEMARKHLPFAIVLDIMLPGMDGWAVLKELKRDIHTQHIPVHIMTASDERGNNMDNLGAISFLKKPVSKETMENVFAGLLQLQKSGYRKVLIVEDQEAMSNRLREMFEAEGIITAQASTGKKGLDLLMEEDFDCVVLDLNLPDMSGIELLETMRDNDRLSKIPVVINTSMEITPEMNQAIMKLTPALVLKTSKSNDRLLDEVNLFIQKLRKEEPRLAAQKKQKKADAFFLSDDVLKHKKLLLVDDDMRNVFALSSSLQSYDLKIDIANNGREALEKLDAAPDTDIVLMDIMMPEMDGYEAMQEIRRKPQFKKLPIIALTAKAMKEDRIKCLEAGANDYITKPVEIDKLLSLIRVWLSK